MTTVDLGAAQPRTYKAMVALSSAAERAAADAGLAALTIELIKLRASQLNGCAYCLRMHTRDAIAAGETSDRLAVLPAWWESQYFGETEQAALALTERVTDLTGTAPRHELPVVPEDVLGEAQFAAVSWLAIVMNAWNRVAVTGHTPVAP